MNTTLTPTKTSSQTIEDFANHCLETLTNNQHLDNKQNITILLESIHWSHYFNELSSWIEDLYSNDYSISQLVDKFLSMWDSKHISGFDTYL